MFVIGGGGGSFSFILWDEGSPIVVRVSPNCLLVRGNSANLVRGMAYRMSRVLSLFFWAAL